MPSRDVEEVDAVRYVGEVLAHAIVDSAGAVDRDDLDRRALGLGEQEVELLERRLHAPGVGPDYLVPVHVAGDVDVAVAPRAAGLVGANCAGRRGAVP